MSVFQKECFMPGLLSALSLGPSSPGFEHFVTLLQTLQSAAPFLREAARVLVCCSSFTPLSSCMQLFSQDRD